MDPHFWHERWHTGQIGFHQSEVNSDLQRWWPTLGLAPQTPVLVPLCGKSQDMLWLLAQGHPVIGVELSPLAVAAFWQENAIPAQAVPSRTLHRSQSPDGAMTLLTGDFFDLTPDDLPCVGAVYDRAALIALPPELRKKYAAHLQHILQTPVPMLILTMDYPEAARTPPPFPVPESEIGCLYSPTYDLACLSSRNTLDAPENARWRELGVRWLKESVYALHPKTSAVR
jgi:thiopurine S-methyltransferase